MMRTRCSAGIIFIASIASADVVIDMPSPPAQMAQAQAQEVAPGQDAKASDANVERAVASDTAKANPSASTTKVPVDSPLTQFANRTQAQDSAGNPRGVNVPSVYFASGGWGDGYGRDWAGYDTFGWGDGFEDGFGGYSNFGWGGGWGMPIYWGGCCPSPVWGGGCGSTYGGYGFGWSASSISIGGGGAFFRAGSVGVIR
jgi:hypothetical protein